MKEGTVLYWAYMTHGEQRLVAAASDEGLCYVGGWDESWETFTEWAQKSFGNVALVQDEAAMEEYIRELAQYMAGKRSAFTVPVQLKGTPFQREVWTAMCAVPYGETASYDDIARQIGRPSAARAVGTAIGRNPVLILAPCHRIIGKSGKLTGYRGGLPMKEQLLALEKVNASSGV